MAKLTGIIKLEGTIENLIFYKMNGENYVRSKGGVSKERIYTDPNFARTRENNSEFTESSHAGMVLRNAIGFLVCKAKGSYLSSRMLQMMSKIKDLDGLSARGMRKVSIGIAAAEGKLHLKGFDFNNFASLKNVLFAPFTLASATGIVAITEFIPKEQLQFPQGATHVSFQNAVLQLDFETKKFEVACSDVFNLCIDLPVSSVLLAPASMPTGSGVLLFLLAISFYQEVNGIQYSLKNEEFNVLNVLEVL